MYRLGWLVLGVFAAIVVLGAGALWWTSQTGISAREEPPALERWTAKRLRAAAIPRDAATRKNPVVSSPEVLNEARAHWADHCALCHDNDGSGGTLIGKRTYPPAPDMRQPDTQHLTDGELFYIIQNGVRLTAMPGWGGSAHDEQDSWKLVHFIRHLPSLTVEEKKEMEKLNPKGPDDRKEEEEEEKFLNGEDTHEPTEHHHH